MSEGDGDRQDTDFSTLKLPFGPGEWCDADERMFHACFAILGQYVEDELGTKPWEGGEASLYRGYRKHAVEGDDKAIDLWLWYRDELPALEEAYEDDIQDKFEYDYPGTVKDEKLRELIGMRRKLWT